MKIPNHRRLARTFQQWFHFIATVRTTKLEGHPILVTGAQRCGTTWFGQMIHRPGTRLYHEPLGRFGTLWNYDLANLEGGVNEIGLSQTISDIMSGREWRTYNFSHHLPIDRTPSRLSPVRFFGSGNGRVIIKDPTAIGMLGSVASIQRVKTVILIRHPCGHVSSLKRLNWDPETRVNLLLRHPSFEGRFDDISEKLSGLALHERSLSFVEKIAVQYCLLLRLAMQFHHKNDHSIVVNYDELASNPIDEFKNVFAMLELPYNRKVRQRHEFLTSSTPCSSKGRHETKRDSKLASIRWKNDLSENEIRDVMSIWNQIGPTGFGFHS